MERPQRSRREIPRGRGGVSRTRRSESCSASLAPLVGAACLIRLQVMEGPRKTHHLPLVPKRSPLPTNYLFNPANYLLLPTRPSLRSTCYSPPTLSDSYAFPTTSDTLYLKVGVENGAPKAHTRHRRLRPGTERLTVAMEAQASCCRGGGRVD